MKNPISTDHLGQSVLDLLHPDFARISACHTVGEALSHVQRSHVTERIVYFYVIDDDGRLQGVVPTRALLLNPPETPIAQIMVRRLVTLPSTATLLDACELFMLHRFLALPVVDAEGHMLGVVDVSLYTDEMIDMADREASHNLFQLIGVRLSQVRHAPVLAVFHRRFPWLLCNVTGGMVCALLANAYRPVLEQIVVLALFIPVVLALGESISIQSLSLVLQSQHGGRPEWRSVGWALIREIRIGALLGLASGLTVALAAWLWQRQPWVALCMAASVVLSATTAAMLGLLVPTVLRSLQRDPKVASGPIALTLSDIASLFYFLGLAACWLPR